MYRIAFTAWMGMTVRNLLYGPALDESLKNYEVTIISNYGHLLNEVMHNEKIRYERLNIPKWQLPSIQSFLGCCLYEWNYIALWQSKKPRTVELVIQREKETRPIRLVLNRIGGTVVRLLRRRNSERDLLRDVIYFLPASRQLKKFNAVLVSSTDSLKDQMITYTCRRRGIPVVCLVHSWDNLPARGLLAAVPDRLLVWNKYMVEEAINLHGVAPERIDIVGVPQYESYRKIAKQTNENVFRERLNISESVRIITFATSADWVYPDEVELLDKLLIEINKGRFGNAVLVVRLHPTDERTSLYVDKYANSKLPIRLDEADSGFAAMNTGKIGALESVINFVELMQFSSVVLNVASTISLDAILFNTPVVCPDFCFSTPEDAYNSTTKLYDTSHYRRVARSGAICMPKSMDEMLSNIEDAIHFPERKHNERRELAAKLMPDLPTSELIWRSLEVVIEEKRRQLNREFKSPAF